MDNLSDMYSFTITSPAGNEILPQPQQPPSKEKRSLGLEEINCGDHLSSSMALSIFWNVRILRVNCLDILFTSILFSKTLIPAFTSAITEKSRYLVFKYSYQFLSDC